MKLSILTPAFNEELNIKPFITSILEQDFGNWELLMVDDGSSDSTADLIRHFEEQDSRIRLVSHGRKLGKVRAFNRLFEESSGDVIMLPGADDILPDDCLQNRVAPFLPIDPASKAVAYFKLQSFSSDPKFDRIVIPRGTAPSRSGPSITLNRTLASILFPIEETLPAEDIWLSKAADCLADHILLSSEIGIRYRIHGGNSNPRHKPFAEMNESLHVRMLAINAILTCERFEISERERRQLTKTSEAEQLRHQGKTLQILTRSRLPLTSRVAVAAYSNPILFSIRTRFYRQLTGLRGR